MKYLRHFDTSQEAEDFLDNFNGNYNVIASLEGESQPLFVEGAGFTVTYLYDTTGTCNGTPFNSGDSLPAGSTIVLTCPDVGVNPYWYNIPEDAIISGDGWVATFTLNSNVVDAYCYYVVQ